VLLCISHKVGARVYIGTFDREQEKFFPERHTRMNWPGGTFFAPESLLDDKGRRVFWAWVTDPRVGPTQRATGSGFQSLPRILTLGDDGDIRIRPAEELEALRRNGRVSENVALGEEPVILADVRGDTLELALDIDVGDARRVGLKVRCADDTGEETSVFYDARSKTLQIDMSRSTVREDVSYAGQAPFTSFWWEHPDDNTAPWDRVEAPFDLPEGETLRLRVFMDGPMLEVFANDRVCVTQLIYPMSREAFGVQLFALGEGGIVRRLEAWDMAPPRFEAE